uniref:Uncharacterized protein n=1 Tax=Avena sativa TaxID=4498 RepID=A0ACD5ZHQ9_AVESA
MSGMLVRKSSPVLVRPPSPPPATTTTAGGDAIELSACDKAFVGIPNTALLVFTKPIHDPAERIKRALAHALVHYRPLAGRLLRPADADADDDAGSEDEADDYYIACTGEGVSFVAATTASSIDDVRFFNRSIDTSDSSSSTRLFLDDLAVYYPTADGDRPLVLLQVTDFSCGGFVLGVTWNHAAADGAGMGQFINAVANLAVGLPSPSVLPVMRQGAVVVHPAPSPSLLDIDRHFRSFHPPPDMAFLDIVVPSSTVGRVRRRSAGQGRTATMFEAVTAVLWQCRTRAVMSVKPDPGAPTVLCFSADLRRHAGAKLDGYYGNFVTLQRAVSTSGEVAGGDIVEVVKMIQHAKDRIQIPAAMSEKKQKQEDLDRLFLVTYWRNLGFDQVDFGGGKPARVLSCMRGPVGPPVNIITGNGDDGSCNVLSRCLKEHAQPFLHQLATFTTT